MGCFWRPQEEFFQLPGVEQATSGYARAYMSAFDESEELNGDARQSIQRSMRDNPASYFSVCSGDGRTEAVLVEYDPDVISYRDILRHFWQNHDSSEMQLPGKQDQYRSCVWPMNEQQQLIALEELNKVVTYFNESGMRRPKTVIADLPPNGDSETWLKKEFTSAEGIHQNFWSKLRLKLTYIAMSSLFTVSSLGFIDDIVVRSGVQIIFLWMMVEIFELFAAAAGSLGLNPFVSSRDAA